MIDKDIRSNLIRVCVLLLFMSFIVSCSPATAPSTEIKPGSSKEDVIALYGEPDRTQEFIIPDEPFFGPQEGLIDLVPPGTLIEEWVYEIGDKELYIWYAGDNNQAREDRLVLDLGRYPKGAVY
jgi:hypothetical protein